MFPTTTAITSLEAIIPLVPKKSPDQSNQKDKFISFELKARAGQRDSGSTYKKQVKLFDEGTPQEWINLRKDLGEFGPKIRFLDQWTASLLQEQSSEERA